MDMDVKDNKYTRHPSIPNSHSKPGNNRRTFLTANSKHRTPVNRQQGLPTLAESSLSHLPHPGHITQRLGEVINPHQANNNTQRIMMSQKNSPPDPKTTSHIAHALMYAERRNSLLPEEGEEEDGRGRMTTLLGKPISTAYGPRVKLCLLQT